MSVLGRYFGNALGRMIACYWSSRWLVTVRNIHQCFPQLDSHEIAMQSFKHFGRSLLEGITLKSIASSPRVIYEESPCFKALLKVKTGILLTGHAGQWEILNLAIARRCHIPINVLYQKIENPWINRLVIRQRSQFGVTMWDKKSQLIPMLRSVKRSGGLIGIVADQGDGALANFFGQIRPFPDGPEKLAQKMTLPVFWACCLREGDHFRITVKQLSPGSIKEQYVDCLEETIRNAPYQYFWMHRMWKDQVASVQ